MSNEKKIKSYIQKAMNQAKFEVLEDDGSVYAEIPGCQGVYANADTLEKCRKELKEVLEEWVEFRLETELDLPVII